MGGFCPNKNSTFYVYHHSKHSCTSCFAFGGILSRGDFVPTTTWPYLCTPLQLTLIQSKKYFGKILSQGGFYPMKDLVLCFSTPLWLTFIFCNFRGFCPGEDFVPHFTLFVCAPLRLTFILSNYCVWGDFVPGRILSQGVHCSCWRIWSWGVFWPRERFWTWKRNCSMKNLILWKNSI